MFPNFFFSRHYILTLRQDRNNSNDNNKRQSKNNSNDNNITKIICRLTNCAIIIRDEIKIILMIIIRDKIKIILMIIVRDKIEINLMIIIRDKVKIILMITILLRLFVGLPTVR